MCAPDLSCHVARTEQYWHIVLIDQTRRSRCCGRDRQYTRTGAASYILRASARFLATGPDASHCDGKRAVELAKKTVANAVECEFKLAMTEQQKAIEKLKAEESPNKDDTQNARSRVSSETYVIDNHDSWPSDALSGR